MSILIVRSLQKSFGGLRAVKDVSFAIAPKEIVSVVGPNGAGKTTLFSLLTGFIRPDAGEITLNGQRIDGRTPEAVCRAGLVRTFQSSKVFPQMSVLDNVTIGALSRLGNVAAAKREALAIFDLFGARLHECAERPAGTLSWANRTRVEIARALACRPHLIGLDEPTAGMDPAETREIADLIVRIRNEGTTVLVIEHDMNLVMRVSDRIVVLHHGELLMEGSPAEVRNSPQVMEAYLGTGSTAAAN